MTTSVCIFCGSFKIGAWTPCESCGQVPLTEQECIVALVATSQYHDQTTLKRLSSHVRQGGTVDVDQSTEREIRSLLRETKVHELAAAMNLDSLTGGAGDNARRSSQSPARPWEFWKRRRSSAGEERRILELEADALEAARRDDWALALRLLTEALSGQTDSWTARANRGKAFLNLGRYQEAVADLSKALRVCPRGSKAAILNDRGIARRRAGCLDDAVADYSAALELDPEDHRALINRASALAELGDDDAALEDALTLKAMGSREADALIQAVAPKDSASGLQDFPGWRYSPNGPVSWRFGELPLCGCLTFDGNGKATVRATGSHSPLHALAHLWLRWLPERASGRDASRDALIRLEGWAGVVDGAWTVEQEERLANEVEAYLVTRPEAGPLRGANVRSPASELVPTLAELMRLLGTPTRRP